jgi:hypothetical protein
VTQSKIDAMAHAAITDATDRSEPNIGVFISVTGDPEERVKEFRSLGMSLNASNTSRTLFGYVSADDLENVIAKKPWVIRVYGDIPFLITVSEN